MVIDVIQLRPIMGVEEEAHESFGCARQIKLCKKAVSFVPKIGK